MNANANAAGTGIGASTSTNIQQHDEHRHPSNSDGWDRYPEFINTGTCFEVSEDDGDSALAPLRRASYHSQSSHSQAMLGVRTAKVEEATSSDEWVVFSPETSFAEQSSDAEDCEEETDGITGEEEEDGQQTSMFLLLGRGSRIDGTMMTTPVYLPTHEGARGSFASTTVAGVPAVSAETEMAVLATAGAKRAVTPSSSLPADTVSMINRWRLNQSQHSSTTGIDDGEGKVSPFSSSPTDHETTGAVDAEWALAHEFSLIDIKSHGLLSSTAQSIELDNRDDGQTIESSPAVAGSAASLNPSRPSESAPKSKRPWLLVTKRVVHSLRLTGDALRATPAQLGVRAAEALGGILITNSDGHSGLPYTQYGAYIKTQSPPPRFKVRYTQILDQTAVEGARAMMRRRRRLRTTKAKGLHASK